MRVYSVAGLNGQSVDLSCVRVIMNTKPLLLWFISAATTFAADPPSNHPDQLYNATALPPIPLIEMSHFNNVVTKKPVSPLVTLGKSDFVITGPLVEGLRPLQTSEHLNVAQKFLRLPIIRLFVPGPMESPPGTGKYFAWRNSDDDEPWEVRSSRPGIVKGPY